MLSLLDPGPAVTPGLAVRNRAIWTFAALILLFWAAAVALQVAGQAYSSEFDGYPDEPAHYVTGLMVRDYIAGGLPQNPLRYARSYYAHYPKVAFGHWPPVFYFVEAAWMLAFSESRTSVLLLMALITAVTAATLAVGLRRKYGMAPAIAAAAVFVATPAVQIQSAMVMLDMLLALFTLLAAFAFARYLESGTVRDAVLCGIATLLAIMTKGNGWALAPAFAAALLLAGRAPLILRRAFWIFAAIVALALPWQLLTISTVQRALPETMGLAYTAQAGGKFVLILAQICGVPLFCLAFAGIAAACRAALLRRRRLPADDAAMLGLLLGVVAFHSIVPAGAEDRKMIMALPALLYFVLRGAHEVARVVRAPRPFLAPAVSLAVLFLFLAAGFSIPAKPRYGVAGEISSLDSQPALKRENVLVSGGTTFEGAVISEIAMRERRPGQFVLRASKVLGDGGWNGNYRTRFQTSGEIGRFLDGAGVGLVAVEDIPRSGQKYNDLLLQALWQDNQDWRLMFHSPGPYGELSVFERTNPIHPGALSIRPVPVAALQVPGA